jgi:hypothetical protein
VFTEYFKELEEESIRDNFVVIYELLDEMMDFGYPQTTESKILQEYETLVNSEAAEYLYSNWCLSTGISHKSLTNWKFHDLQSPSQTL